MPLQLIYAHLGSPLDYDLRLVACPSSHFEPSGKSDVDIVLSEPLKGLHRTATDNDGNSCRVVEAMMSFKYSTRCSFDVESERNPSHGHLHAKSSISFNVCCSINNDYGRHCTRDGGACYVTLLELVKNKLLSARSGRTAFTFRKVFVSGFNVGKEDRLTGVLGVALGDFDIKALTNSGYLGRPEKWSLCKLVEVESNYRAFLGLLVQRKSNLGNVPTTGIEFVPPDTLLKLLFNVSLEEPQGQTYLGFSNKLTTLFANPRRDKDQDNVGAQQRQTFHKEISLACADYEYMLKQQTNLVDVVEKCTKNMKCPWTPMDTCAWEMFSDYDGGYVLRLQRDSSKSATALVGGSVTKDSTKSFAFPQLALDNSFVQTHVVQMQVLDGEDIARKIGGKSNIPNSAKRQSDWQTSLDSAGHFEKRVYLPFFSYLLCHPLAVYKGYWENALRIMTDRMGYTLEEYARLFFQTYNDSKRCADAAQMICNYVQAIEYISDYYIPRKRRTRDENGSDGRVEIEQFWNCLRSMCGDCDDLTVGHAQVYRAFVVNSWNNPKMNAVIEENGVLKEMRRLLACNYIMFLNIEAVYLPRQKSGGNDDDDDNDGDDGDEDTEGGFYKANMACHSTSCSSGKGVGYGGVDYKSAKGNYARDTRNMNSAHAALKLLPKKYFERCVNRSCSKDVVPIFGVGMAKENSNCCFYHQHPPDDYNDHLPVLFLEGTSMLVCCDELDDPCTNDAFKKVIFSDDILADVTKSPIYAKKGKSSFYKASLFGATLDFLGNHKVATFTFARRPESTISSLSKFVRGASHHQLSWKSECVILVPYGHCYEGSKHITPLPVEGLSGTACGNGVRFKSPEMSSFMRHLCIAESKKRIRARKIKKPGKGQTFGTSLTSLGLTCTPYDFLTHDTGQTLDESRLVLSTFCNNMNAVYAGGRLEAVPRKDPFHVFVDNYYVNADFVNRLTKLIRSALGNSLATNTTGHYWGSDSGWLDTLNEYCTFSSKPRPCENKYMFTSVHLESFSEDLHIWRITFSF